MTVVDSKLGSVSFQGPHCWESCQLKGVRSKFEFKTKKRKEKRKQHSEKIGPL